MELKIVRSSPSRRNHISIAVTIVALAITAVTASACSMSRAKSATSYAPHQTSPAAESSVDAVDFVSLFRNHRPSYVAQYQYVSSSGPAHARVVVQDGSSFKTSDISGRGRDVEVFDTNGRLATCSNASIRWVCTRVASEATLPSNTTLTPMSTLNGFERFFGRAGQRISISQRAEAGVSVRCGRGATAGFRETLCLSQAGVIGYMSVVRAGVSWTLTLTKLTMTVAPGQFVLPAPVTAGPGT
jgi:hypothetical protein